MGSDRGNWKGFNRNMDETKYLSEIKWKTISFTLKFKSNIAVARIIDKENKRQGVNDV